MYKVIVFMYVLLVKCLFVFRMWRAGVNVKTVTTADDDDWETDPDFVVSGMHTLPYYYTGSIQSIMCNRVSTQPN